jgi:hypothetical protein
MSPKGWGKIGFIGYENGSRVTDLLKKPFGVRQWEQRHPPRDGFDPSSSPDAVRSRCLEIERTDLRGGSRGDPATCREQR